MRLPSPNGRSLPGPVLDHRAVARAMWRWLAVVLAALAFSAARAERTSVVNFRTYLSASGQYALEVDPTEIYGRGPAHYRLVASGREVWSATFLFTLHNAVVTNEGASIGYSYDHGEYGFATQGGVDAGVGNIHVVVLDPKGKVRLDDVRKRKFTGMLHSPPAPTISGILLQEDQDRFILRAAGEEGEDFWSYRCSTGKVLGRFNIKKASAAPASANFVISAQPISSTPLIAVAWMVFDRTKKPNSRHLFMLLTPDGHPVWSRDVAAEGGSAGNEEVEDQLRAQIFRTGLILDATKPAQFDLWFVAESQRVSFSVTPDKSLKGGWRVEESARKPYQPPPDEQPSPPSAESRPLRSLGSFQLENSGAEVSHFDIDCFDFDSEGRIGTIRRTQDELSFVRLDPEGRVLETIALPKTAYDAEIGRCQAAHVGQGKWVVVASEQKQEARSWGWWFDPAEKRLSKPFPLVCPEITSIAGAGDGGFVVLATRRSRYSSVKEMHAFDRQGSHLWAVIEKNDGDRKNLFSPESLTVTTKGEVAVLDNIAKVVQFFGLDGKFRRFVDLKKSWHRDPNYPSTIMPDTQGGYVVGDFNGNPPFVRMKADDTVRGPVLPRHPDGRLVDTVGGLHVDPDGNCWVCDQHGLFRLDEEGVVNRTLGRAPNPNDLEKIAAVTGDRHGQFYAVDERTGAVHVFDEGGKKLRVCQPNPGDFKENMRSPSITVADDGGVYLAENRFQLAQTHYLQFGPDGRRIGFSDFKADTSEEIYAQPGTGHLLLLGFQSAGMIEPDGKVLQRLERQADRLWLDSISGAAFASDGSFAIHSENSGAGGGPAITLFTRDGSPIRSFRLSSGWTSLVGYNGSHVVMKRGEQVEIYDSKGDLGQSFAPGSGNEWDAFLTREGRELWSVDFAKRTVQRFAMP